MTEKIMDAEWLTTKYLRAGDEIAHTGNPRRAPTSMRLVERVEIIGSMKDIYFADGTRLHVGSATKLWIRKPAPVAR